MKIINLMLSRGRGGIEQAFINSAQAIQDFSDFDQLCIVDQSSKITDQLDMPAIKLRQFADWDPLAIWQLHKLIKKFQPDIILCHGNRPLKMILRIKYILGIYDRLLSKSSILLSEQEKNFEKPERTQMHTRVLKKFLTYLENKRQRLRMASRFKVVGFCHNFSIKHLLKADAIISVSQYIQDHHIIPSGYPVDRVFHIPNMINLKDYIPITLQPQNPIRIGTMGRFVKKKGLEDYIRALKILVDRGYSIQAILGGTGAEETNLRSLADELDLNTSLKFSGWVHDKRAFYEQLDLFCLPSREEPFGIIALETLAYGLPMVATRTTGPSEFLVDEENAILCNHTNPMDLANAIEKAIGLDDTERHKMVQNGFATVKNFDLITVSQRLVACLNKIMRLF